VRVIDFVRRAVEPFSGETGGDADVELRVQRREVAKLVFIFSIVFSVVSMVDVERGKKCLGGWDTKSMSERKRMVDVENI